MLFQSFHTCEISFPCYLLSVEILWFGFPDSMLHDSILSTRSGPGNTLSKTIFGHWLIYTFVLKVVLTSLLMVCNGTQLSELLPVMKYLVK